MSDKQKSLIRNIICVFWISYVVKCDSKFTAVTVGHLPSCMLSLCGPERCVFFKKLPPTPPTDCLIALNFAGGCRSCSCSHQPSPRSTLSRTDPESHLPHRSHPFRLRLFLPAWKILQSNPTGCLLLCSVQTLWPVFPLILASCLLEKRVRPSSLVRTLTTPACPLSSPAKATAGCRPPTDIALFDRCSPHLASSATFSCWTGPPATP